MLYHTVDQLCIFLILGHPGERVKLKYSLETSIQVVSQFLPFGPRVPDRWLPLETYLTAPLSR